MPNLHLCQSPFCMKGGRGAFKKGGFLTLVPNVQRNPASTVVAAAAHGATESSPRAVAITRNPRPRSILGQPSSHVVGPGCGFAREHSSMPLKQSSLGLGEQSTAMLEAQSRNLDQRTSGGLQRERGYGGIPSAFPFPTSN